MWKIKIRFSLMMCIFFILNNAVAFGKSSIDFAVKEKIEVPVGKTLKVSQKRFARVTNESSEFIKVEQSVLNGNLKIKALKVGRGFLTFHSALDGSVSKVQIDVIAKKSPKNQRSPKQDFQMQCGMVRKRGCPQGRGMSLPGWD
jgi:hypothetical protein